VESHPTNRDQAKILSFIKCHRGFMKEYNHKRGSIVLWRSSRCECFESLAAVSRRYLAFRIKYWFYKCLQELNIR
jgi:hypothetical protein